MGTTYTFVVACANESEIAATLGLTDFWGGTTEVNASTVTTTIRATPNNTPFLDRMYNLGPTSRMRFSIFKHMLYIAYRIHR